MGGDCFLVTVTYLLGSNDAILDFLFPDNNSSHRAYIITHASTTICGLGMDWSSVTLIYILMSNEVSFGYSISR